MKECKHYEIERLFVKNLAKCIVEHEKMYKELVVQEECECCGKLFRIDVYFKLKVGEPTIKWDSYDEF